MGVKFLITTRAPILGGLLVASVAVLGACSDDDSDDACTHAETQDIACGSDQLGHQPQTCVNGQWHSTSFCKKPDGSRHPEDTFSTEDGQCIQSATRAAVCGANNQGLRPEECQRGEWVATNDCSYGPGNGNSDGGNGDGGNGDGGDGGSPGVPDQHGCTTYEDVPSRIAADTTLDGCYKAAQSVYVSAALRIEPGSVLLFAENTELRISVDGSMNAVGTEQKGILIAGESSIAGLWIGVNFIDSDRLANELSYVTIEDGGKDEGTGLSVIGNSRVVIDHTTVRNSNGAGFYADEHAKLPDFSTNTFTQNEVFAAHMHPTAVGYLDAESDFRGNESDVVAIYGGKISSAVTWPGLNATYSVLGSITIQGAAAMVTIEPGATLQFAENTELYVTSHSALNAEGTSSKRIVFKGAKSVNEYWKGIRLRFSNRDENQLRYVTIQDAGRNRDAPLDIHGSGGGGHTRLGLVSVIFDGDGPAITLNDETTLSPCENLAINSIQIVGDGATGAIEDCGL